jgi:hypothetical protein
MIDGLRCHDFDSGGGGSAVHDIDIVAPQLIRVLGG